jgi:hypothetical protein
MGARVWQSSWVFDGEADLESYLPVGDFVMVNFTACFQNLKPAHVFDRFGRALKRLVDCVLNSDSGSADQFDQFVGMVYHKKRLKIVPGFVFGLRTPSYKSAKLPSLFCRKAVPISRQNAINVITHCKVP